MELAAVFCSPRKFVGIVFVTQKITVMEQVVGLQKQHLSTDFDKIGIYGKLRMRPISLYMNCRPQYKMKLLFLKRH